MSKAELAYRRGQVSAALADAQNELNKLTATFQPFHVHPDRLQPQPLLELCIDTTARCLELQETIRILARCATIAGAVMPTRWVAFLVHNNAVDSLAVAVVEPVGVR